jgi:DNA-binding transcriptional regulator YdaS (Cro superfamily)
MQSTSPIERAVSAAGGISKLAAALSITPTTVHEWVTHKRQVPASRCQAIVRISGGLVSLQELRPDDWADYWPNLAAAPAHAGECAICSVAQA